MTLLKNPTLELKPDMFATIMLQADLGREAVLIPREAYIDSGLRKGGAKIRQFKFVQKDIKTRSR